MESFFWFLTIPLIGIILPIWLSFEEDIKVKNKVYLFLLLPIGETLLSILAIVKSYDKNTNLIDAWQLLLICLITIFGLSLTLIVAFVEELNYKIKLTIKLTALLILSFIAIWGIARF